MERGLWQYLKTVKKPIVLYGMGNGADKIIKVLEEHEIPFTGVFASDGFVRDKMFHGHKISSYGELKEKLGDMVVLLCFGSERPEVIANVKRISLEQELYAPEVPVIGAGLFTKEYYEENKARFDAVYEHLADDASRKTFINTIKYKISGDIKYLFECQVESDEPYQSFLKLTSNETFLDLGAYTGDTVKDFIKRVDSYNKIIAAEPDTKSFKKLLINTEKYKNIECMNVAVSAKCETALFGMRGGRNSGITDGKTEVRVMNVDSIAAGRAITFIKMDVEGEELNTIIGAKRTIVEQKPKMAVSCYHRTEDLLTLPEAVYNMRGDYKLYMRHFESLPAWDTNYYFV